MSIEENEISITLLNNFFDINNVPEEKRATLIRKFRIEVAHVMRPKWNGRLWNGGELATLSAPMFLKRVHADFIDPNGNVDIEAIGVIDAGLLRTVSMYMAKRRLRKQDMGDAEGLHLPASRPGRKSISKARPRGAVFQ